MPTVALAFALALAPALACSGDDSGSGFGPDRPPPCDPLLQTGCDAGDKCSVVLPPVGDDRDGFTDCVPAGDRAEGESCAFTASPEDPDGARVDDCAAGLVCGNDAVCARACAAGVRGSCATDELACIALNRFFEDVGGGDDVGVCVPQCDPLDRGATCSAAEGCYVFFLTSEFLCTEPATGAAELRFMDECQPQPRPGGCFVNSAPPGAVSFLALDWFEQATSTPRVSPLCRAISTHSGSLAPDQTASGDPASPGLRCGVGLLSSGNAQCRHLQSIYSNPELSLIAEGVGLCVPTATSDPPGQSYNDAVTFDLDAWAANPQTSTNPGGVPFCPGCMTSQEFTDALIAAAVARDRAPWRLEDVIPRASPARVRALESALRANSAPVIR